MEYYSYSVYFKRNIGLFSSSEQEMIKNLKVGIAGVGGVGGITAERLTRLGVGCIKIADPDHFEPSNFNHQIFSNSKTLNFNKANIVAQELKKINPQINISSFEDGINESNVEGFVNDCDIIINAIEYNTIGAHVILHSEAKKQNKFVLWSPALGFGTNLLVFDPAGVSFEDYIGLSGGVTENYVIPADKFCKRIPNYIDPITVQKVVNREMYIPSCSLGVTASAAMLVSAIIAMFIKSKKLPSVPDSIVFDYLMDLFDR